MEDYESDEGEGCRPVPGAAASVVQSWLVVEGVGSSIVVVVVNELVMGWRWVVE